MEVGHLKLKKHERTVDMEMSRDVIENHIKSSHSSSPFILSRKSTAASCDTSVGPKELRSNTKHPRYQSKSQRQVQMKLPLRMCEQYARHIAPVRKQLLQSQHISYNQTVIDTMERDRYTHPNYNVDIPKKKKPAKIDARYGE